MKKPLNPIYNRYPITPKYAEEPPAEHLVEDARSKRDFPVKSQKSEMKKPPRGKGRTVLLTVAITLLCFSLTIFAADVVGNRGFAAYTALFQKKIKDKVFYAVYATHSADMSISYKNAAAVREEGGAGYVMKEGMEYYVVLNLYESAEDAKKITERKPNYGVLEINVPPFNAKKESALSSAENSKDLYKEAYLMLYQAANDLAAGKYQKQDMLREIKAYKEKVVVAENAYAESIRGKEEPITIEYKVILAEIRSAFENLEQNFERPVADARYYSVMIVRSFALFSQKYFG